MNNLILTSNGFIEKDNRCANYIIKKCTDKKVLIVDNATTTGSNQKGLDEVFNHFKEITKDVIVLTLSGDNLQKILGYDFVYVAGGDLMPLLKLIHECDASAVIFSFLKNGGVMIGESAGAIVFNKNCKYYYDLKKGTKEKYNIIPKSYDGLNLVDINIFPHWNKQTNDMKEKVLNYEIDNKMKITPLNDGGYLEFAIKKAVN